MRRHPAQPYHPMITNTPWLREAPLRTRFANEPPPLPLSRLRIGARSGRRRPHVHAQPALLATVLYAYDYDQNVLRDDGRVAGNSKYNPIRFIGCFDGSLILPMHQQLHLYIS